MLFLDNTRIDHSVNATVGTISGTGSITDEGMALVIDGARGDGITVKPSTGTSGEVFYGIALYERRAPTSLYGELVIQGSGTSSSAPAANTSAYTINNVTSLGTHVVSGTGAASGDVTQALANGTVTVGTTATFYADKTARIRYIYTPTLDDTISLVGTTIDATPLSEGADVCCGRQGQYFTSYFLFNSSTTYTIGAKLGLHTGGLVAPTAQASGPDIEAYVVHVPDADVPWLGFELF